MMLQVLTDCKSSSCKELLDQDISGNVQPRESSLGVETVCRDAGRDCGTDSDPLFVGSQTTIV